MIIIGTKIGFLTLVERVSPPVDKKSRGRYYRCVCSSCGNQNYVNDAGTLRSGRIKACGCLGRTGTPQVNTTHGHSRSNGGKPSATYATWQGMKSRCSSPGHAQFVYYGGRGISYDPRWEDFAVFLRDMGTRPEGTELDRTNNAEGYCKENCRWVDHRTNCWNRGVPA